MDKMTKDKNFDLGAEISETHAFVQWKGTDLCMDFYCECGAHCHFDGFFAYTVKCQHCNQIWEMPAYVFPRKVSAETNEYWRENAKPLEPDEDYSEEYVDADGVTRYRALPVAL